MLYWDRCIKPIKWFSSSLMVTSLPFLMLQNYPNFWFYPYGRVEAKVLSHVTFMPVLLRPVTNFLGQVIGNAFEGKYNTGVAGQQFPRPVLPPGVGAHACHPWLRQCLLPVLYWADCSPHVD